MFSTIARSVSVPKSGAGPISNGASIQAARAVSLLSAIVVAFGVSGAAGAAEIDLTHYADVELNGLTDGTAYPNPGQTTIGGIAFTLPAFNGGTGAIRSVAGPVVIPINQFGVTKVYGIVNSQDGGSYGADVGSITFTDATASYTVALIEGTNVRDHYNGYYNNTTADAYATENFGGGVRFDVYEYDLPAGFATETLQSVTFDGFNRGFPYGSPFLAGLTTNVNAAPAAVPEPAAWALMIGGFGFVGAGMRRQRAIAISYS